MLGVLMDIDDFLLEAVEVAYKMMGEGWGFTAKEAQTELNHRISPLRTPITREVHWEMPSLG